MNKQKTIAFDLDDVLCYRLDEYEHLGPNKYVDIYTHLYTKTNEQLNSWGLKYHQLVMGKIHYDILIDDKAINSFNINKNTIITFLK